MVDRSFFLSLMAFALLLSYFVLVYFVLAPFLPALIWACVIGIATFPLYRRLRHRLKNRHTLAAAVMTPAVLLLLAVPVATVLILVAVELDALYDSMQVKMLEGNFLTFGRLRQWPAISQILQYLQPVTDDFHIDLGETVTPALQNLFSAAVTQSQKIAKGLLSMLLQTVVMVFALFFLYRDGERLLPAFSALIPLPEDRKFQLTEATRNILYAILYGVFLTALVQGNLALLGYWIVGLPSPVVLGVVTTLASLVPVAGTALVWGPAALYLLLSGEVVKGIILLAWGALVVATADNFIRPYLICGRGQVHFLTVLLGILGGLAAFGLPGLVAGPIILALFLAIADIYSPLLPPPPDPTIVTPEKTE